MDRQAGPSIDRIRKGRPISHCAAEAVFRSKEGYYLSAGLLE